MALPNERRVMIDASPRHSRGPGLIVLCLASLMVVLDGTVVVVALPSIQADLGFTSSNLAWVVNAYLVPFGGLLLLSGRLGDLLGKRRVFLAGLGVFTLASLACGLAGNEAMLIAFRFVQGVGGALATAVVLGMIVTLFPDSREQSKALGLFSFVQAAGASIGMILGGVLTDALSWNWTMLVNVPIGVAVILGAITFLDGDRGAGLRAGVDVAGAVLVTAGVVLLIYAIVSVGAAGPRWTLFALAVVILAGFVVRQAKAPTPLLPLKLFRSRSVSASNVVVILAVAGMMGFQFLTALYLQRVMSLSALATGFAFLPTPITNAASSMYLGPRLIARIGARPVMAGGLFTAALGLALLARVPVDGNYFADVLPPLLLAGIGMGAAVPAMIGSAMSVTDPQYTGVASGLVNTTLQIGGALGTAVLAAIYNAAGPAPLEAIAGFRLAYVGATCFVAVAGIAALILIPRRGGGRAIAS